MDHAHETGAAVGGPASGVDHQILTMWKALRSNPSLDARWAMQLVGRLLESIATRPAG